jgi:hydrogenase maturation protease
LPEANAILVLGIGNLLRRDEGFGVHTIRMLAERYQPSANVRLLDGGTAGVALLDAILGCDRLVVIDVARMGAPPGTLARLERGRLPSAFKAKQSAHDWGFAEILLQARVLGHEPEVVVIAAEPQDMDTWSDELSPLLASRLSDAVEQVVAAVEAAGGWFGAASRPCAKTASRGK